MAGERPMKICPKCALFVMNPTCAFCKVPMVITDITAKESLHMPSKQREELINHYIETLIKDTYDPKIREEREEWERNQGSPWASYQGAKAKCPTCGSTNVRSISGAERGASILGLGIFSNKINKSFKCNSCGYTW
ncbi:MAG: hypothetical protein HFH23_18000 [Ruminococcus sp.]|nr:hypothetical protein [Ruminococcus sp.]